MPRSTILSAIASVGVDIGKNVFHVVGHDKSGAIVLRQKWSRGQVENRFANMPSCLVGMEACVEVILLPLGIRPDVLLVPEGLELAGEMTRADV
jgi:hypothetical protein